MSTLREQGSAARVIASIRGDRDQREAAFVELDTIIARGDSSGGGEREALVDVAVACVGPLIKTVFAADVSVVDAAEFRRAHLVLGKLSLLDPLRLIGEWARESRLGIAWGTPGNAWAKVFGKDPSELTRDDALTVAAPQSMYAIQWCRGAVIRFR
jgi:hypothetical protein